ncbi:MAG: response regulator [bacterium]
MPAKILLIEPDDICRKLVSQRLSISGYHVISTSDGKSALQLAAEKKPDAVISELDLSQVSGLQFCQTIKQDTQTAHIPVIFLTYKQMLQDKLAAFEAGAADYITKPFSLAELEARLNVVLQK